MSEQEKEAGVEEERECVRSAEAATQTNKKAIMYNKKAKM
jgi:hypothetical protein